VQALYRQFSPSETLGVFGAPTFVIEGELYWARTGSISSIAGSTPSAPAAGAAVGIGERRK